MPRSVTTTRRLRSAPVASVVAASGALAASCASFLPWYGIHIDFGPLYSNTLAGNAWTAWPGVTAALAAIVALVVAVLRFFRPAALSQVLLPNRVTFILFGLLVLGGTVWYEVLRLRASVSTLGGVATTIGIGAFVAAVGALALVIGGALSPQ